MNILGVIMARGGSKGVPKKNIKILAGKPLIAWTIEEAKKSQYINRLILTTDDEEIAKIGRDCGCEVPFMRPKELAEDKVKSLPVFKHCLNWLKENENYLPDIIVQLKPTNPNRTAKHIDEAIENFLASPEIDSLMSVNLASTHPLKTWLVDDKNIMKPYIPESFSGIKDAARSPRQSLPKAYVHNSAVNVIKPSTILEKDSMNGALIKAYVMDEESSLNINTPFDFKIAEMIFKEKFK